jgi:hypothetical protein
MTSALTAFAIAVSGVSLICFALMTRAERRRNKRGTSSDSGGSDGGTYTGDSGSHFWNWFGSDHAASDSSDHSAVGDSWGGGDSGGDGGGDGGGSD